MAGNLVKKVMLKIVADDGDSEAKLDRITAKADELGRLHPDIKVKVDAAAASAKLAVLRKDLKDSAAAASAPHKFSFSGLLPAIGQMGLMQKVLLGVNAATTVLEPALAGGIVAAGGLASGLAAAGMGLGVFGVVAKSVYGQASGAVQQWGTATSTTGKASTAAMARYRAELAALPPSQQAVARSIIGVKTEWQNFVQANTSGVATVMSQGIGVLPRVFALMRPFLAPVEHALSDIIAKAKTGLGSSSFVHEIGDFAKASGPDLEKTAVAAGHVAMGILGILHAFLPTSGTILSGLDNWTARFQRWGQTLSGHSGFQSLMSMFRTETPIAMHVLGNLGSVIKTVAADMTGLSGVGNSKTLLQLAMPFTSLLKVLVQANPDLVRIALYLLAAGSAGKKLAGVFGGVKDSISFLQSGASAISSFTRGFGDAEQAASAATGVWGTFGGKISNLGSTFQGVAVKMGILRTATEEGTVAQEGLDVAMEANPIGIIVMAIAALAAGIVLLVVRCKPFRDFWVHMWHDVEHIVGEAVSWVKSHWTEVIVGLLTGPVGLAALYIYDHWASIEHGAMHMVDDVTGWFARLPGMILHAVGNLGSLLWQGGVNLVMGLVHGIESVAMAPVHALGSLVSGLRSLLPFSPAKTGPLSGSGSPDIAGRKIATMLAQGITAGSPSVQAAARRMAAAAAPPVTAGHAAPGAGAAGAPVVIEIRPGGGSGLDQQFWTWLANGIRSRGGDPRVIVRKVAFA